MEGTGYEVGIKGSHFDGKLNSSVALFKIEQDNLAIWIDTPGGNTYKSEQGTTTKGVEFTLDGELAEAGRHPPVMPTRSAPTLTISASLPPCRATASRPSPAIACRGF
jgi:outer membrane cobalamin receptor